MHHPLLGGTDGFRAEATMEPGPGRMNPETISGLTSQLLTVAAEEYPDSNPILVVTRDTRPSGIALAEAAMAAGVGHGLDVLNLGVAPTPAAQKIAANLGARATVAITASHNPWQYNGWKGMFGPEKPLGDQVQALSDGYWARVESGLHAPVYEGGALDAREHIHDYMDGIVDAVERVFGARPLEGKIFAYDGANGAGIHFTPVVLERLGAKVHRFACDEKGIINDGVGAADLSGARKFLERHPEITSDEQYVGLLANDGDDDRVMGLGIAQVNGERQIVELNGNHMMAALATHGDDGKKEHGIVGTLYTNTATRRALGMLGIGFKECGNGDTYVTETLRAMSRSGQRWRRGGEFTGHLIDLGWLNSGDGVYMAAWMAAYAATQGKTFGKLVQDLPLWPETMLKVTLDRGQNARRILADEGVQQTLSGVAEDLGSDGRHVTRASGTDPLIRVWTEALDAKAGREAAHTIRASVMDAARRVA